MPTTNLPKTGIIKGVDLIAYLTSDPKSAIAYYRDVLGMVPTEIDDKGRGAEFTLSDGNTFGVWQPDEGPSSGATYMFAVDDAKEAVAEFRARGAKLSDVEETPVCYMAVGTDFEGNSYIIHQRKPAN